MTDALKKLFGSRRFLVGLAAALTAVARDLFKLDLSEETMFGILGLAGTWMAGTSAADYAAARDAPAVK